MELEQLRQLVAIVDCGTMSKAAERLHISQPSISRNMHALETELGQELFEHARNRITLNDAGAIALDSARKVLADVDVMRGDLDEHAKRKRTIRLGTVAPAPMWLLTERTVTAHPGTIFSTEYLGEQDLERALLDRSVDLAILIRPLALPNMTSRQLMTEALSVEAPADDELAGRDHVTWEDINGRPFLVLESIGFWMGIVRDNLPDSQIIVQQDPQVFTQLVASSDLLNFVTDASAFSHPSTGRVRIPIWGTGASATYFAACLNDSSEQVRRVLDLFG
ncbi:LysR family transcriptional regulator [Olsenella sp. Marseille-P4559]|uniref:LysR family transcriptional regulator n=1 Tax=Olsenella sp. Marseille-P4559 TaxID=2364795 RepID=UPI0010326B35|nr:LysR family transcriptional regulator [Olsenella sp. Marseille-P4559]